MEKIHRHPFDSVSGSQLPFGGRTLLWSFVPSTILVHRTPHSIRVSCGLGFSPLDPVHGVFSKLLTLGSRVAGLRLTWGRLNDVSRVQVESKNGVPSRRVPLSIDTRTETGTESPHEQ